QPIDRPEVGPNATMPPGGRHWEASSALRTSPKLAGGRAIRTQSPPRSGCVATPNTLVTAQRDAIRNGDATNAPKIARVRVPGAPRNGLWRPPTATIPQRDRMG